MFTLENVHTAPSYEALTRNGFTAQEVVNYYKLEPNQRGAYFKAIKDALGKVEEPKVEPKKVGTQKCTLESLKALCLEYMGKDFTYRGKTYNMLKMGWEFDWMDSRRAIGKCTRRSTYDFMGNRTIVNKRIKLSRFFANNSDGNLEQWIDVILHEIAHAIDVEYRGTSDHSYAWKSVAVAVGADPSRTIDNFEVDYKAYKYTLTCPSCGEQYGMSRMPKRDKSCGKCSPTFDRRYIFKVTQNY